MNKIIKQESAISLHGVEARAFNVVANEETGRILNQKISATRYYNGRKGKYSIQVELRFDDECRNGHETFAITASIRENGREYMGGCCHEEIVKHFPELAHLIKWHLVSTDGPMHYIANTIYHASNRDHHGCLAGEPRNFNYAVKFDNVPLTHPISENFSEFLQKRTGTGNFQVVAFAHEREPEKYGTHYSLVGFGEKWNEAPFRNEEEAQDFCKAMNTCKAEFVKTPSQFGEGKSRELDSARSTAVWPDASDEILCADPAVLKAALIERLPALLDAFKADMLACGFTWPTTK